MTNINSGIFIEGQSGSGQRVLHPAEILDSMKRVITAKLQTTELECELGQKLMVYYQIGDKFLKQPALIESCDTSEEMSDIQFTLLDEPVSAEQRETYRVSAAMAELYVDISDEMGCELLDISMTGCSFISNVQYLLGQLVHITFYHEGEPITGEAVVQSVRQFDAERTRYGLHCICVRDTDSRLKRCLREITMTIQRSQLQRLSRV